MFEEWYICQNCGAESDEELEFQTDVDNCIDTDNMTCESCYDDINEEAKQDEGIKVFAEIKNESEIWKEDFMCVSLETAESEIKSTIEGFNDTLRKGEVKREFVKIVDGE